MFLDRCDLCGDVDPNCEWVEGPDLPDPKVACAPCRLVKHPYLQRVRGEGKKVRKFDEDEYLDSLPDDDGVSKPRF